MNLLDKILAETDKLVNQTRKVANVADVILNKVMPQTTASAGGCWYEYRCGGVHMHCLGAMCFYHKHRRRRQCCYRGGATIGCNSWYDHGGAC